MEKNLNGSGLSWILLRMNILPIILLTLVITTFSAVQFAGSMNEEVKNGLVSLCDSVITMYETMYEGDYRAVEQDGAIYMLKGDHQFNGDFAFIDSVKEKTNIDITLFYQDTRVITTIRDKEGKRVVGTRANPSVVQKVLEGDHETFFSSTDIEGDKYFSYYAPLHAEDGSCIGMIFFGRPAAEVDALVHKSVSPIIIFGLITMLLVCFITMRFSRHLVESIRKIEGFLESSSGGNLHAKLNEEVVKRKDELGELGRHVVKMQRALRELVEQDMLTGLHNRRSGEKMLRQVQDSYEKKGIPFCVVIGDIDHFKHVNDTYGHECGDVVLMEVSSLFKRHMHGKGFAVRWGGEEFLFLFSESNGDEAYMILNGLRDEIKSLEVEYGDLRLKVTMTFGLVEIDRARSLDESIREADQLLYNGKENGRDRIVY